MNNPVKNWRETKKLKELLGEEGRLLFWTQVLTPPTEFEYQAPYFVGIIELKKGIKMSVQIVDCELGDLKSNLKIKLVIRRLKKPGPSDIIDYSLKAIPA